MKRKLMVLLLVAGGALLAEPRVSIGVQFGAPVPAPVAVGAYRPPCPGPGYVWVEGYYDAYQNWVPGYWALPPYAGAYWVAPRFSSGRFFAGYWGGVRGDYRAETHEHDGWRGAERNKPEIRGGASGRERGVGVERGGELRNGYRR